MCRSLTYFQSAFSPGVESNSLNICTYCILWVMACIVVNVLRVEWDVCNRVKCVEPVKYLENLSSSSIYHQRIGNRREAVSLSKQKLAHFTWLPVTILYKREMMGDRDSPAGGERHEINWNSALSTSRSDIWYDTIRAWIESTRDEFQGKGFSPFLKNNYLWYNGPELLWLSKLGIVASSYY